MTILQLSTFWIHPVLCSKVSLTNKQRVKRPVHVRVYENGGEDVGQNNRSKYGEKKAFTIRKRVINGIVSGISSPLCVCYVMLCYVMLCYVMLCYVMLCYVMLCYVMLCYVMLCYVMLCYVMLCYVMLCYVMLCYVIQLAHSLGAFQWPITSSILRLLLT